MRSQDDLPPSYQNSSWRRYYLFVGNRAALRLASEHPAPKRSGAKTIAAIALVLATTSAAFARSAYTTESRQDLWKNLHNSSGASVNSDPFPSEPDPDFCIECTWPEGSSTYHGGNGP